MKGKGKVVGIGSWLGFFVIYGRKGEVIRGLS